jgi:hypothetical protein
LLCGRNVVRNVRQSDVESLWELTAEGKSKIQMTNVANAPRRVIDPRCGVPLADLTVIELHTHLLRAGWECHVKLKTTRSGKGKAIHDDGTPIFQDYKVGSAKTWWIRPTDVAFRFKYLLALASADEHKQPVRHLATDEYYACLLEGRPFVKRASKRKFDFVDGDDGAAKLRAPRRPTNKPAAAKQARPRKFRLARAKRLAKAKAKVVAVPEGVSNDSDSSESNPMGSDSSSSSSSSRSSTSSSSSSGSKSSAEVPQPQ